MHSSKLRFLFECCDIITRPSLKQKLCWVEFRRKFEVLCLAVLDNFRNKTQHMYSFSVLLSCFIYNILFFLNYVFHWTSPLRQFLSLF